MRYGIIIADKKHKMHKRSTNGSIQEDGLPLRLLPRRALFRQSVRFLFLLSSSYFCFGGLCGQLPGMGRG
jgi:hypothetical protein